jgi:hypothetical protein
MKVTKSYIKQLIMEELSLEAEQGGTTFGAGEEAAASAPNTYLDLYKKMGQMIRDAGGKSSPELEAKLEGIVQQMISLHPEQEPRIRRRAVFQRQITK